MAKEALYFPEDGIPAMVTIIRTGLQELDVAPKVRDELGDWCDEMEDYWRSNMTAPFQAPERIRPAPPAPKPPRHRPPTTKTRR